MGKKKEAPAVEAEGAVNEAGAVENPSETPPELQDPAPDSEPPKKSKKGSRKLSGIATLADLAAGYLAHMESEGKSDGTISSYRMELKTAAAELGEETPLAEITVERVQAFFTCKRVTKLRSGKNKAKPSVDKTRRVLRLALCWAEERGIVAKAPLPEPANA